MTNKCISEFKFRERLAREQSKALKKSSEEHDRLTNISLKRLKQGKPITDTLIKKEKDWAKRNLDLRDRLFNQFNIAIKKYRKRCLHKN